MRICLPVVNVLVILASFVPSANSQTLYGSLLGNVKRS
jgi:hypothetical protein